MKAKYGRERMGSGGFLKYAKKKDFIDFNVEDVINDMDLKDSYLIKKA